jgi:hypothetical protein
VLPKVNTLRPALWMLFFVVFAPQMLFLGCAGGSPNFRQFFGSTSAEPAREQAMSTETAAASATPTPASQSRTHKKFGKDVHVAAKKASQASESAAEASAKAQQASKQSQPAADAASKAETEGDASSKSVVSLEASPVAISASTPSAAITIGAVPGSTPAARPTLSLESSATASASAPPAAIAAEPSAMDAAKLIAEVDKIENLIDRNNLSADEAQRDILAQRLLLGASKALAERDHVAAISLANKASTLLAPLPKIPSPVNRAKR